MARKATRHAKAKPRAKTRPRTKGRKDVGDGGGPPPEDESRLSRFVGVQQRAVTRFSDFAKDVADLTMTGDYTPSSWATKYGTMWKNLAKDVADMTKIFFEN